MVIYPEAPSIYFSTYHSFFDKYFFLEVKLRILSNKTSNNMVRKRIFGRFLRHITANFANCELFSSVPNYDTWGLVTTVNKTEFPYFPLFLLGRVWCISEILVNRDWSFNFQRWDLKLDLRWPFLWSVVVGDNANLFVICCYLLTQWTHVWIHRPTIESSIKCHCYSYHLVRKRK